MYLRRFIKRKVTCIGFGWGNTLKLNKYILSVFLLFQIVIVNAETDLSRIGYAYESSTNELLYTENHHEEYKSGLISHSKVIYKDVQANIFASKTADFSNSQFMPEFSLENMLTGHEEKTRFIEDKYEIIFSESKNKSRKESRISYKDNAISDAGFDNFIINNWDEIIAGKKFKRDFLVPSMLDFISFRIYQEAMIDKDDRSLRLINIEPDSFFVRIIAGTLKLYYDSDKPALRIFEGVSNLRDMKGDNYNVVIKYEDVKSQVLSVNK